MSNSLQTMPNLSCFTLNIPFNDNIGLPNFLRPFDKYSHLKTLGLQLALKEQEEFDLLFDFLQHQNKAENLSLGINSSDLVQTTDMLQLRELLISKDNVITLENAQKLFKIIGSYTKLKTLKMIVGDIVVPDETKELEILELFDNSPALYKLELNFGKGFLNDNQMKKILHSYGKHPKIRDLNVKFSIGSLTDEGFKNMIQFIKLFGQRREIEMIPVGASRAKKEEIRTLIQKLKEYRCSRL
jgi:hypothetical protein